MKKYINLIFLLLAIQSISIAQNSMRLDSLRHELSIATHDTSRMHLMNRIRQIYFANRPDSAIFYSIKVLALARQLNMPEVELTALGTITLSQIHLGNYSRALQINLEAIKIAEKNSLTERNPSLLLQSGMIYEMSNNHLQALNTYRKVKRIGDSTNRTFYSIYAASSMAKTFLSMNQLDSALNYGHLVDDYAQRLNRYTTYPRFVLGQIYFKKGNNELALKYLDESLRSSRNTSETFDRLHMIALVYYQIGMPDSSIYYANKALKISQENVIYSGIIKANILLLEIYEKRNLEKALQHSKSAIAYKDTLDNFRKNATLDAFIDFDEQNRQYEIESATASYRNKVQRLWKFSISGGLISAVMLSFMLYRNIKNKQKANTFLNQQKEQISIQKDKAEKALAELKSTQSQLIQSEKMASLGELTAGIAHEIQNPLNFVNNYSEVSKELAEELKEEAQKPKLDSILISELAEDIVSNQEKIHHHGSRASGIVKGMLEHSRTGDGVKELTDLNALADEYLRLACHGLRAKDKSFNADFKTEFDEMLPKINVVPQDIGRVLLNLINNAFYAVDKKAKSGIEGYKPEVAVSTKKLERSIEIQVKDNGEGIPEQVRDKIFQPFFTTKPTGSGTGLGLSLAYDIVKAHGGEITLENEEGEGSNFRILLSIQNS